MFKITAIVANLMYIEARLSTGQCEDVEYVADFKPEKFAGHWYEIVRDTQNPYTISTDCVTKDFTLNKDGDIDLYFRGYYSLFGDYMGVDGTMYQCDEGSSKTWTCMATMGGRSHRRPFKIFDTDYTSYEIMYACENINSFSKTELFAVSSRSPTASK